MIWSFWWGVRLSRFSCVIQKKDIISGDGVIPFWIISVPVGLYMNIYLLRGIDADERNGLCVWVLDCN